MYTLVIVLKQLLLRQSGLGETIFLFLFLWNLFSLVPKATDVLRLPKEKRIICIKASVRIV